MFVLTSRSVHVAYKADDNSLIFEGNYISLNTNLISQFLNEYISLICQHSSRDKREDSLVK